MIITAFKNEEIFKVYKIGKSCFSDDYRILVDTPRYEKKNESVVDRDGKSDKLFATRELAAEFVFNQIDKHMSIGYVDKYTVDYN
jgi:hypothetical protein